MHKSNESGSDHARSPGIRFAQFRVRKKCIHVITVTVATDPMKSDKVGWMAGELKPPE